MRLQETPIKCWFLSGLLPGKRSREALGKPQDAQAPQNGPKAFPGALRGLPARVKDSQAWPCYFLRAREGQMSICLRRRAFIAALGGAAAWPLVTRAQQSAFPIVGFLSPGSPESDAFSLTVFRQALNETGFVVGRNDR